MGMTKRNPGRPKGTKKQNNRQRVSCTLPVILAMYLKKKENASKTIQHALEMYMDWEQGKGENMFLKLEKYYHWKIDTLEEAINGTKRALMKHRADHAPEKIIEAHEAQIMAYRKSLLTVIREFEKFEKEHLS